MCRSSSPIASKAPGRCTGKTSTPTVASGCSAFWWWKAKSPRPGRALGRTTSRSCWTRTSDSGFPAHTGWWRTSGLDGRGGRHRQRRQVATTVSANGCFWTDQFGTERTLARRAFRQRRTLDALLIGRDDQRRDDADERTQQQSQQKETKRVASLGTGNPGAENGKRQPTDKSAYHVNDLPYGLKDPPGPGSYGSARLASADRALPGEHTRSYARPVKKVLIPNGD